LLSIFRQPAPVQPQVQPQPQLPQQPQPLRPRTRRPPVRPPTPAPFQPQPQPQQQNFNVQQSLQTPPQPPPSPPHVQQPFQSRQPFAPQTQFQRPQQPPPQQFQTPPPTTPAPQLPFAGQQNLRTGVCPMSIFYISTPISGPTRLSFTHFAIAVTVDQCARTCHEFNCAIAHYNPSNGHCEFNPSTAFAIRNGQCPAWPSLHYRNNVVASEPVRIFCVTCQRPRRRQNRTRNLSLRQRSRDPHQANTSRRNAFRGHRNAKRTTNNRQRSRDPHQANTSRRNAFRGHRNAKRTTNNRVSSHPVIHGVLVKQPKAIALGVSQLSFNTPVESKTRELAVGVSPTLYEDGGDSSTFQEARRSSGSSNREYDCDLESNGTYFVKCKDSLGGSPLLGVKKNHLFFTKDRAGDRRQAIRFAVKHWWSRVRKDGGIGQEVTFKEGNAGRPISTFTKMAWATTQKMACVARECPYHWSVVCLYNPGGNQVGSQIYERGSPCTACPTGYTCNTDSLCQMST
uniref:SCP domain-containing protein n=1 Tax=Haemonchus placei TaxID=6290 RepID=A0A0N4X1L1_HAEPC